MTSTFANTPHPNPPNLTSTFTNKRRPHPRPTPGLELRDDRIVIGPLWPESLGGLAFPFRYRGHRLRLSVRGRGATLSAEPGDAPPVQVECRGAQQTLVAGGTVRFSR
ncbi:glycosyl hydrolase family 65 protein [Mycolicibacterium iranicum]|uniref:glycosyl hydrolase family 65 protein n=1 Tax=Mycolicibacterium iranicum TaxID=912594 RepID=UPI0039903E8A